MTVPLPGPDRSAALARLGRPAPRRRSLFRAGAWGTPLDDPGDDPGELARGGPTGGAAPTADEAPPVRRAPRPPADPWDGGFGPRTVAWWHSAPPGRRGLVLLGGVVVVVAALLVWPLVRRPAAADAALPTAATDAATRSLGDIATPAGGAPPPTSTTIGPAGAERAGPVVVHVAGAVAAPGVVRLDPTSRVVDAVAAAGGLRPDADSDRVNLAAPVVDGTRIVVPVVGQPAPAEVAAAPAADPAASPVGGDAAGSGGGPVDLNTADAGQLDALPGVGPTTAAAILDHRERNGPFRTVDDLLDVRGIGEAKLEALRDLVVVGG